MTVTPGAGDWTDIDTNCLKWFL